MGVLDFIPQKNYSDYSNLFPDPYFLSYRQTGVYDINYNTPTGLGTSFVITEAEPFNPFNTLAQKRRDLTFSNKLIRGASLAQTTLKAAEKIYACLAIYIPPNNPNLSLSYSLVSINASATGTTIASGLFTTGGLKTVIMPLVTIPSDCVTLQIWSGQFGAASTRVYDSILGVGLYRQPSNTTADLSAQILQAFVTSMGLRSRRQLALASNYFALVGGTGSPTAIEEFNLYYDNFINKGGADVINAVANYGRNYSFGYRMQAGNSGISYYNLASGNVPLTINLLDNSLKNIASSATTINLVPKTVTTDQVILNVGDSMTAAEVWQAQVKAVLPGNIYMSGTRTNSNGTVCQEGRGGRTLTFYLTQAMMPAGNTNEVAESPFLFPSGVTGANYKGATNFWAAVVNNTGSANDIQGSQKIASGWGTPGTWVFDTNGYPLTPTTGMVVFDATKTAGNQLQEYTGPAWATMPVARCTAVSIGVASTTTFSRASGSFLTDGCFVGGVVYMQGFTNAANNGKFVITAVTATVLTVSVATLVVEAATSTKAYSAYVFDLGKYLTQYAVAFNQTGSFRAPNYMAILLGTNDFYTIASADSGNAYVNYLNYYLVMIAAIRAYSTTMKIIVMLPIVATNQDGFALNRGATMLAASARQNIIDIRSRMLEYFDTSAYRTSNLYVCDLTPSVDPVAGWDTTTENYNKFSTTQRTLNSNYVHPSNACGYKQMGDAVAALIQYLRV